MTFHERVEALEYEIIDEDTYFYQSFYSGQTDPEKSPASNVCDFLEQKGFFRTTEDDWQLLDKGTARRYFVQMFTKTLAYSGQLFSVEEAESYWERLLAFFPEGPLCYANFSDENDVASFLEGGSYGYSPLTKDVFSRGLVMMAGTDILAIVLTDND